MVNDADLIQRLGIDPELIRRDLDSCYAAARYYGEMRREDSNNAAFAATLLRRAAAHSLLVMENQEDRDAVFLDAARAYRDLQMPYSFMLLVFVQRTKVDFFADDFFFTDRNEQSKEQINDLLQRVYLLLASTNRQWNRNWAYQSQSLREELEMYRQKPIGILGISIGSYLQLFDSLRAHATNDVSEEGKRLTDDNTDRWEVIRRSLQPFLVSYDRALERVRQDRFHWERLAVPFHPAEIDILSVLLYVYKSMNARDDGRAVKNFIGSPLLSEQTRFLLDAILADYI